MKEFIDKFDIDPRYSTFSVSIFLHLIHNDEKFKNLWIKGYPKTESFANNFFNNENCGCRPSLISAYRRNRFNADLMIVAYLKENPDVLNFDEFCNGNGGQDLSGHVFAIPQEEAHYKDFLAALQQKNSIYSHFNTIQMNDKILITFF